MGGGDRIFLFSTISSFLSLKFPTASLFFPLSSLFPTHQPYLSSVFSFHFFPTPGSFLSGKLRPSYADPASGLVPGAQCFPSTPVAWWGAHKDFQEGAPHFPYIPLPHTISAFPSPSNPIASSFLAFFLLPSTNQPTIYLPHSLYLYLLLSYFFYTSPSYQNNLHHSPFLHCILTTIL